MPEYIPEVLRHVAKSWGKKANWTGSVTLGVAIALAFVAHAHADVHQELEEAFLIFQHIAPER
jgi:glycine cleavage system aminomethyltransferase T